MCHLHLLDAIRVFLSGTTPLIASYPRMTSLVIYLALLGIVIAGGSYFFSK